MGQLYLTVYKDTPGLMLPISALDHDLTARCYYLDIWHYSTSKTCLHKESRTSKAQMILKTSSRPYIQDSHMMCGEGKTHIKSKKVAYYKSSHSSSLVCCELHLKTMLNSEPLLYTISVSWLSAVSFLDAVSP